MPRIQTIVLDLALAAFMFTAAGCLVGSSKNVCESGKAVSPNTLQQVQVGKTTQAWLLATLGPPTSRNPVADQPGVEILTYSHQVVETSQGHVFLLFSGSNRKVNSHRTYFEIADGLVSRYWTDE
jgi:hypothetical protein